MATITELFGAELKVINTGTEIFKKELDKCGTVSLQVDWKPSARGDLELIEALDGLETIEGRIAAANRELQERLQNAHPVLVDIGKALEVIPGMTENTILHAGPPVAWGNMAGPLKGAVLGALIYEGLAKNLEEAGKLAGSGKIIFDPCHEHGAVGPMAGVISASMPVFVFHNSVHGNKSFSNFNEGLGKVLRFGAWNEEVVTRLQWIEKVLAPGLKKAVQLSGGIDVRVILAQAVQMGDEGHNRNKAATLLFLKNITPLLIKTGLSEQDLLAILAFINNNDHFFLNMSMAYCKGVMDSARDIPYCSIVTVMTRNGRDFGIKISGLGDEWFTAKAEHVNGLLFPGYTREDANPDMGDSAITETAGIGGFAMAAAPAIVQFVGGSAKDADAYTRKMYEITQGENKHITIPQLNFRGTPTGIDIRKVVEKGILPQINTGIAHKEAGVGQIGAGLVNPPWECFKQALLAFSREYLQ